MTPINKSFHAKYYNSLIETQRTYKRFDKMLEEYKIVEEIPDAKINEV